MARFSAVPLYCVQKVTDEENISAAQQEQKEDPRLPGQNEDRERKGCDKEKAREGEKTAHRLDGTDAGEERKAAQKGFPRRSLGKVRQIAAFSSIQEYEE